MDIKRQFRNNLRRLIEEKGLKEGQFADRIEKAPAYLSQILNGRRYPRPDLMEKICGEIGVSYDVLHSDIGKSSDFSANEYTFIPKARASVSSGDGFTAIEDGVESRLYAFRTDWLRKIAGPTNNLLLVDVVGDSMERLIRDGDSILVDRSRNKISDGKIYVVSYGDETYVKYLYKLPDGRVSVESENRAVYRPREADVKDIRVHARVIWGARVF